MKSGLNKQGICFERGPEGLIGVITFKPVLIHWAIIGISLLMVGHILVYAFFENFGPILMLHQPLKQKTAWSGSFLFL